MRPIREDIDTIRKEHSFVAYALSVPQFDFRWHYHPECELTLIIKGSGKRIVGDSHDSFEAGDLVLVGPGIPHTWSGGSADEGAEAIVIQFSEGFVAPFLALPEFEAARRLLEKARRALHFHPVPEDVRARLKALPDLSPAIRVTELVALLDRLTYEAPRMLASDTFSIGRHADAQRINAACHYIQEKAATGLTLGKVAAQVHLSPSAFCKFFKRHTGRAFSDYVNDVRMADASLLLAHTDKTIRQVATDTGYESLTYFNRVFRQRKKMTPSEFRKNAKSTI